MFWKLNFDKAKDLRILPFNKLVKKAMILFKEYDNVNNVYLEDSNGKKMGKLVEKILKKYELLARGGYKTPVFNLT